MFPDPRLAKAVVDRITHKAHIISTKGTQVRTIAAFWRVR